MIRSVVIHSVDGVRQYSRPGFRGRIMSRAKPIVSDAVVEHDCGCGAVEPEDCGCPTDDSVEFEESKHPRDPDGKFAEKGGGGSSKPAVSNIRHKGNPEYSRMTTKALEDYVQSYEEQAGTFGEKWDWFSENVLKPYREELEWRRAIEKERREDTHSIGDLTETHNVSYEFLVDNSQVIDVEGIEYRIGYGVGYSPLSGGPSEMFEGKIVEGPRDELGKSAVDIPAVRRAIESVYKESTVWKGGDFARATSTDRRDLVAKLLYGYKSPLTGDAYKAFLLPMARAYLRDGAVEAPSGNDPVAEIRKSIKETLESVRAGGQKEQIEWVGKWAEENLTPEREVKIMLSNIREASWKSKLTSQECVAQFKSFAEDTQKVLRKKYPSGKVTVYRGVSGEYAKRIKEALNTGATIEVPVESVDSWSESLDIAKKFASRGGVVIKQEVPIERILFSWQGPSGAGLNAGDYLFGGEEEQENLIAHPESHLKLSKSDFGQ